MGHPERVVPYCARQFRVLDDQGHELASGEDNFQTRRVFRFGKPVTTSSIHIELKPPGPNVPAALMEVRCYAE